MKPVCFLFLFFLSLQALAQKFEGLALTPPMGWNSWNTFQTRISEELVRGIADQMVLSGMRDAGYTYLVLDDGWMAMERDSLTGNLLADPQKFPSGMKALADYIHAKGLKFGLYNCAGTKTCAGYPGTRGFEYQDARLYASWGIDYLKFDWCNTEGINAREAYATMSKALRAARHPIVFSLCEWGTAKPWEWAAPLGQLWRTTGDIAPYFDSVVDHGTWKSWGVMPIVDQQNGLRAFAGPGHWNDPDMLEVGNGLTAEENRAHFSLWALMAAPLIAGNDLRGMSPAMRAVLTNREVIAIDQDSLEIQGLRWQIRDSVEIWCKPLRNGDWALGFVNRSRTQQVWTIPWSSVIIPETLTGRTLDASGQAFAYRDLWNPEKRGATSPAGSFSCMLAPHDAVLLRLTPTPKKY